ncbi:MULTISPECIES: hypothetical protein [Streptomycetaceae]|jgi:hypothetical protein|uniref:hypothetical protein n=1 Tax=Streptomycetaceae TaxID=2062 RepID=UPI003009F62B
MGDGGAGAETPAQKKARAAELRTCAQKARTMAGTLGTFLDTTVNQATANPPIWAGPYAETTTSTLAERRNRLRVMADDLIRDSVRWTSEASRLEDEAAKDGAKKPAGSH